jgi:lipid-A-disaccharide synthase
VVERGERRLLIVAGEPSGDAHAARLVRALRSLGPCRVRGVAGPRMRAEGVEPVLPMESLAVLGFTGILAKLPALLRARDRLLAELDSFRPAAVVLVDYPGFNLRLGPLLKARGARVFYYIAPQVWAWHPERAAAMARWVDRLAVVFPFEEPIFREAGVTTRFVGHPLLDDLAPEVGEAALRAELGVAPGRPLLALLPGSRAGEVSRLLRPMLEAAAILRRRRPDLAVAVAGAEGLPDALYERQRRHGSVVVPVLRGRTHSLQAHATACAVASGTATLETALLGTPHVIVYRVGAINYAIARRLVTLERIGLPNIVAGEEVAPELVQGTLTPEALAARLAPWLEDPSRRQAAAGLLARVRERLGGPGASAAAAAWLWELAP